MLSKNDKEKACLVDAFVNKVVALVKLHLISAAESDNEENKSVLLKDILEVYTEAGKYIEITDSKVRAIECLLIWYKH